MMEQSAHRVRVPISVKESTQEPIKTLARSDSVSPQNQLQTTY